MTIQSNPIETRGNNKHGKLLKTTAVLGALVIIYSVVNLWLPSQEESIVSWLTKHEGLTNVSLTFDDNNGSIRLWQAQVPDTGCVVSAVRSASSEGWYLANYNESWYNQPFESGRSMPPRDVTIASVAMDHPEICISSR